MWNLLALHCRQKESIKKYNMYFILFILAVSDVSLVINWEVVFLFTVKVMVSVSHRLYIKPPWHHPFVPQLWLLKHRL